MKFDVIWFDRKFKFVHPPEQFPAVVERLRGTAARLEEKLKDIAENVLTHKEGEGWTIKEQAGHLIVVEKLWTIRTDEYIAGKDSLFAADIQNNLTKSTNFNNADINDLITQFRKTRDKLVAKLDVLDKDAPSRTAHHPRLNMAMRMIDHTLFIAEHDDHHLAKIQDIIAARK